MKKIILAAFSALSLTAAIAPLASAATVHSGPYDKASARHTGIACAPAPEGRMFNLWSLASSGSDRPSLEHRRMS